MVNPLALLLSIIMVIIRKQKFEKHGVLKYLPERGQMNIMPLMYEENDKKSTD